MRAFIIAVVSMLGILFIMSLPAPANAQSSPEQFLEGLIKQAQTLQTLQSDIGEIDGLFVNLVQNHFDTRRIGRFVLGRYWRHATDKQHWRFLKLFERISIKRYTPMLRDLPLDTFKILSVDDDDYNNIIVTSTITKTDKTIKIRWRLRMDYFPEYQITDITAEGISMALTLRAEYGEIVRQHGVDGLLRKLEERLNDT